MATSLPMHRLVPALLLSLCCVVTGCHHQPASAAEARAEARAEVASARAEVDQIPPPTKSRYMSVRSYDGWENPWLTVQPDMLTLHILLADANPSAFGSGGMLRPIGARRQKVNIRLGKLPEAMGAIPASSWPYGRVVAVEEAHQTPGAQEPVVRRNMEAAVGILNDMGIVAYDLTEGNSR